MSSPLFPPFLPKLRELAVTGWLFQYERQKYCLKRWNQLSLYTDPIPHSYIVYLLETEPCHFPQQHPIHLYETEQISFHTRSQYPSTASNLCNFAHIHNITYILLKNYIQCIYVYSTGVRSPDTHCSDIVICVRKETNGMRIPPINYKTCHDGL